MSNNDVDNDLDVEAFDDTEGFETYNKKTSLGDLWRNNAMVKIGVVIAILAVGAGGLVLFGGSGDLEDLSQVAGPSSVREVPGTSEVSETMRESLETANIERAEEALRTSGSAIPTPIEPVKGSLPLPVEEQAAEDPLERWRRMQEDRLRQQEILAQAAAKSQPQMEDARAPAVNALSEAMMQQMQSILSNQKINPPNHAEITNVAYLEQLEQRKLQKLQQEQVALSRVGGGAQGNGQNGSVQVENILIPAGTIEYGQLLIEANTDAPGPVLVQVVSGPLSGSRLLGSFTSTENYLVLSFSQAVIDGISYPVQAVAINPDTTLPGVVTDIDRRYFKRIVLPMAAEFISGLTEAISESGTTSVYVADGSVTESSADKDNEQEVASGISEAGDKLSEILDEEAQKTKPMLKIRTGTPVGVLFTQPVTDSMQSANR